MTFPALFSFPALTALATLPASAQIYADVSTTLGDFSIELYHEEAPMAVANLITLAEGSRAWIDSTTGEIRRDTPYYDGIIFHRVIDDFMNQAGSQDGTGGDGPGYNFPDEIDNGLQHDEPYLLSAANSGPHTNGSQFFTTVVPTPWLDGLHTVFGEIVSGTETIDTINDTDVEGTRPTTPVVINSMTIRREGAAALAFDEFAQGLPTVSAVELELVGPTSEDSARLLYEQAPGSTLKVASSPDLLSWAFSERYLDLEGEGLSEFQTDGVREREFFRANLVEWADERFFPESLQGKTITVTSDIGTFTIALTDPGSFVLSLSSGEEIAGEIDYERSTFEHDPYGASWLIFSEPGGLVPTRFRLGADLPIDSPLSGRSSGTVFTSPDATSISGTFVVSE